MSEALIDRERRVATTRQDPDKEAQRLIAKLQALGHTVTLEPPRPDTTPPIKTWPRSPGGVRCRLPG